MINVELKDYSERLMKAVNAGSKKAVLKLCNDTVTLAKKLSPVITGNLRNSISYRVPGMGGLITSENPKEGEGYVGAMAEYATSVEYGKLKRAPKPFMRPAIDSVSKGIPAIDTISKIVNRAVNHDLPKA